MQQSSQSRPLDALAVTAMVVLCLTWGFNQVAIKLAFPDIPPLTQAVVRSVIAALLVAAYAKWRGQTLFKRDGTLLPGITAGILFGVEFLLIYRGLIWTTATRAVLFIYLAPFFVVIGSRWFIPGDHFHRSQWIGL
ncbi:MAG: DMT family transporter, partial [Hyphomicrobiales bacterium]|nr:DMT family transporter [Hyphomicrobiales bacterium]